MIRKKCNCLRNKQKPNTDWSILSCFLWKVNDFSRKDAIQGDMDAINVTFSVFGPGMAAFWIETAICLIILFIATKHFLLWWEIIGENNVFYRDLVTFLMTPRHQWCIHATPKYFHSIAWYNILTFHTSLKKLRWLSRLSSGGNLTFIFCLLH